MLISAAVSVLTMLSRQPMPRHSRLYASATEASWPLITSAANPKLKMVKKLHARKQREKSGLVLLEGHRLVLDALGAGLVPEYVVLHDAALHESAEGEALHAALSEASSQVLRAPADLVNAVSDTTTPQGVLAVLPTPSLPLPPSPSLVLVCDGVRDPGNLGTLLRSAAGAGVCAALLTPGCSDPFGLKALRSGMGAQFRLPISSLPWEETSTQLSEWGAAAHAADASGATSHFEVDWRKPSALVVGSEAHGLSEAVRADPSVRLCRIPMGAAGDGNLESLNAAVAGSVMLFEAQRQRLQPG